MGSAATVPSVSYQDYLAIERESEHKHEYIRGEVVMMVGGTPSHAQLAMNLALELGRLLAGKPCQVYGSDLKVRHIENEFAAYPDVSVVCEKLSFGEDDPNAITNPALVVEVLSKGTEARDRGVKAMHYRQIPSLQEYLLVSQEETRIELYRRNEAGHWELYEATAGGSLTLATVEGEIEVDAVYRDPFAES